MDTKILIFICFVALIQLVSAGSFFIDFNNNTFVKDGQPFRYVSGSIHPYRVPRALWLDRLNKMWTAGLNAIQMYIYWSEHEPHPGVYDFDGQNDIFTFIKMAQSIGFVVILRPGPYICGEHDFGGLPWWLLTNGADSIALRTNDQNYMSAVRNWFSILFPKIAPLLYKNGGPIITVQIENEYGFYYACDSEYLNNLRDIFRNYLGDDVVYFTTDPSSVLKCGTIKGVYATVDFGTGDSPSDAFAGQRKYSPQGPLVNSEFYPGWLDIWGIPHQTVDTSIILKSFYQMMDMGANVNFYMFHGGTNFGYSNGADPPYQPQPTSYDYDAPISEPGDVTNKYLAIRQAISKYLPVPQVPIPANSTKKAYGKIQMTYHSPLIDAIVRNSNKCVTTKYPSTFESLGQGYGFVLYYTTLSDPNVYGKVLSIPGIRDRAYIQIGSASVGVLYRNTNSNITINLQNNKNTTLYIIVENMARLNFGNDLHQSKGIISNVTLDDVLLTQWTQCLTDNFVPNFQKKLNPKNNNKEHFENDEIDMQYDNHKFERKTTTEMNGIDYKAPAIYMGYFDVPNGVYDTFLKMGQFTKGVAFVRSNDTLTNLGRYWPHYGPQVTVYVPGVFTSPSFSNAIILMEFENALCDNPDQCYVELLDYPILDGFKNS